MADRKPVVWNGVEYPSITAAAKANYVAVTTMLYRLRRGYTGDDDMYLGNPARIPIEIDGVEYPSIAEAARQTGQPYYKLLREYHEGVHTP